MTLRLRPFSWQTVEPDLPQDNSLILAWCFDQDSRRYLLRFEDFPVSMYVELPRVRDIVWNGAWANQIRVSLDKRLGVYAMTHCSFASGARTLYHARSERDRNDPLLFLRFRNEASRRKCVNILRRPLDVMRAGEVLRLQFTPLECEAGSIPNVRKFLTHARLHYTQWMEVSAVRVEEGDTISSLELEYVGDYESIRPLSEKDCDTLPTPSLLAFDIECYSSNHRAMPDRWALTDEIFMISCIYQESKRRETRKRYCLVSAEVEEIEDTTVIVVKDELELIEGFCRLVRELDPDIVLGHNILQFDYPYMDARLRSAAETWSRLGRLVGEKCEVVTHQWESSAYGPVSLKYPKASGRVIGLDTMPLIKRDHRLIHYDLDSVSRHFLGRGKHDVTPQEMFAAFANSRQVGDEAAVREMTRVARYCVQDSELCVDLVDELEAWVTLVELAGIVDVSLMDLFTRGQQIRCISQLYDAAHSAKTEIVLSYREPLDVHFSGAYIHTPVPGLYENTICGDFSSLYPSILMGHNMCYTTLVPKELEVPDELCHVIEFEQEEPLTRVRVGDEEDLPEGYREKDTNLERGQKKKGATHRVKYRFRFLREPEGLVPGIVRRLVERRAYVRDVQLKTEKDPLKRTVLNARQLALKVCANSFYGYLGIKKGAKFPLMEAALSVTAKGRELLGEVRKYVDTTYPGASFIYADTDSVMYQLKEIESSKDCCYWGERICQEVSGVQVGDPLPGTDPRSKDPNDKHKVARPGLFPPPLTLAYEKSMLLLLLKKKKYAAHLITRSGEYEREDLRGLGGKILGKSDKLKILKRGLTIARRDSCRSLRDVYTVLLERILARESFSASLAIIFDFVEALLDGKMTPKELSITKQLGANYSSETSYMRLFSERLLREGKKVTPGDRLEFLMFSSAAQHLGDKLCLLEQYVAEPEKYTLDYGAYVTRMMQRPLDQLFGVGYGRALGKLSEIVYYVPPRCRKRITIASPVEFIWRASQERSISVLRGMVGEVLLSAGVL